MVRRRPAGFMLDALLLVVLAPQLCTAVICDGNETNDCNGSLGSCTSSGLCVVDQTTKICCTKPLDSVDGVHNDTCQSNLDPADLCKGDVGITDIGNGDDVVNENTPTVAPTKKPTNIVDNDTCFAVTNCAACLATPLPSDGNKNCAWFPGTEKCFSTECNDGLGCGVLDVCPTLSPSPTTPPSTSGSPTASPSSAPVKTDADTCFANTNCADCLATPLPSDGSKNCAWFPGTDKCFSNECTPLGCGIIDICPTLSPSPTAPPSDLPSGSPTFSVSPSAPPSSAPIVSPSSAPSSHPTRSIAPSSGPSRVASAVPSIAGSAAPSSQPSASPSGVPTLSRAPSDSPSNVLSDSPSLAPSALPTITLSPSSRPTSSLAPSETLSDAPSAVPSVVPSAFPSTSEFPSTQPSLSGKPSAVPSLEPSTPPSTLPSLFPSDLPSLSDAPSDIPSNQPSNSPTGAPSLSPRPSTSPTATSGPTASGAPSEVPTVTSSPTATAAPSSVCYDEPPNWSMEFITGVFGCDWFATSNGACINYGDIPGTDGKVAAEACCACGGGSCGINACQPTALPSGVPSVGPTQAPTTTQAPTRSPAPTDAPTMAPTRPSPLNDARSTSTSMPRAVASFSVLVSCIAAFCLACLWLHPLQI